MRYEIWSGGGTSGYSRSELPLQKRGAGRSPEGINAADSRIRTNCGEHSTSRSLFCAAADPPEYSIFLSWYCFDPLSQLRCQLPFDVRGALGAVRICREAEKTEVCRCRPANTVCSRMELPLQKRGAGRSPEGINAADSRIRTNCGEHSTSRSLFCAAADPPEYSIFLSWYCFDPLSQLR